MAEYIEREAAIEAVKSLYPAIPLVKLNIDKWHEKNKAYMECETAIERIPAADVRPVKRGKWTLNKDGSGTCSECGFVQNSCWDLDNWDNFCHHCGADMREEN